VDATYILHLEGNGRYKDIEKQLEKFHPTNKVYIVHNKGFKKCKKTLPSQISNEDLIDANLETFLHAKEMGYQNILILEDDFQFKDDIGDSKTLLSLNNFFLSKQSDPFLYLLGMVPAVVAPTTEDHLRILYAGTTHAVIYSEACRELYLSEPRDAFVDWDQYNDKHYTIKYAYYKPLCVQTFPKTENRGNWTYNFASFLHTFLTYFIDKSITLLNLHKSPEPGTSIFYFLSTFLSGSLFVLFIYLVILLFRAVANQ
jgi:hypothetical protein